MKKVFFSMLTYLALVSPRVAPAALWSGWVELAQIRPTQFVLGLEEVAEKREKLEGMGDGERRKYLRKKAAPAVIGPEGAIYISDRHHLARAAEEAGVEKIYVEVDADWSDLSPRAFWKQMREAGRVYLFEAGQGPLSPSLLPDRLSAMHDDPYRSLAWKVRKRGGYEKSTQRFAEFYWADFFRSRVANWDGSKAFKAAVTSALALAESAEARELPGYRGEAPECGALLSGLVR